MLESLIAKRWIIAQLKKSAPLVTALTSVEGKRARMFDTFVLPKSPYPYLVYQMQGPGDTIAELGAVRIAVRFFVLVKIAMQTPTYDGTLADLAGLVDGQLHHDTDATFDAEVTLSNAVVGYVLQSTRASLYEQPSEETGVDYKEMGGIYEIVAQQA